MTTLSEWSWGNLQPLSDYMINQEYGLEETVIREDHVARPLMKHTDGYTNDLWGYSMFESSPLVCQLDSSIYFLFSK